MNAQFEALLVKIDALSLRERVFLFLSVIVCCLAVADVLWLSPVMDANKRLVKQFGAQAAELNRLRDELRLVAQPIDPSASVRADIATANRRLDALNEELGAMLPSSKGGPALEDVLVQLLHSYPGLTLLGLTTLQTEGGPRQAASGTPLPVGLTKKGLELRVSGSYAELGRYLQKLETALPALRWGSMVLKSEAQPPEMTLQVFVLGVQPP